ncbi:MAG: glutamate--tRNA ligase family protein, partial [Bacteroidota bacterium]
MSQIDLKSLRRRLEAQPNGGRIITRFAPSPTGYLHLGHVVNMVYVWGLAARLDAEVIVRLEDHDRGRCRPEYRAAILENLEWMGLKTAHESWASLREDVRRSPYMQTNRTAHYEAVIAKLREQGLVYACDCSRKSIRARTGQPGGEEIRYDGHCRGRGVSEEGPHTLRVRLPEGEVEFEDVCLGKMVQVPAEQCGDLPLIDRNGNYTYQLCVVADDIEQGVDFIVRGEDILSSTGRQLLLGR